MQDPLETTKKPSSPARIKASQENGKKSRGPATPEGRLKCSYAARTQYRHNQLADTVLLAGENRTMFMNLVQSYADALQPISEPEYNVVHKLAVAHWRQLRSWTVQQTTFNLEIFRQEDDLPDAVKASFAEMKLCQNHASTLAHAARQEAALDRVFKSSLRDLQFLRKLRGATAGLTEISGPAVCGTWDAQEPRQPVRAIPAPGAGAVKEEGVLEPKPQNPPNPEQIS